MSTMDENKLSTLLQDGSATRTVEPGICSILPEDETGNEYDSQFGFLYDLVACNPIYNRLIWGYPVKIFPDIVSEALQSTSSGPALDIGCGSLAFTARVYRQHTSRIVILVDQSLKMLRMAKKRVMTHDGRIPGNMMFLHSDARSLPFREKIFTTIISENLLHCLDDTFPLLKQIKEITADNGGIYFTTLVKSGRRADRYLQSLADNGKLMSRTADDHRELFSRAGMAVNYRTIGNILLIRCKR